MYRSDRLENNLKIIDILKTCASQNPDLRFWQLLVASGIIEYKDSVYTNVIQVLDYVKPGEVTLISGPDFKEWIYHYQ